jgi:hypothetical protein
MAAPVLFFCSYGGSFLLSERCNLPREKNFPTIDFLCG